MLTTEDLKKKHEIHTERRDEWNLYHLAYEGGAPFIRFALGRHVRESLPNWYERLNEGICLNYSKTIIDLFNFYLTEKAAARKLPGISTDRQWQMFFLDCDLWNTNFDIYLKETQKISSIYGTAGVLIDKTRAKTMSKAFEINNRIYPYCVRYTPPNILDWEFVRNKDTGRPELVFLKLLEEEGFYLVWYKDKWERYRIIEETKTGIKKELRKAVLEDSGKNELGEIPFVWVPNQRRLSKNNYIGVSDIVEISRITASIIRDMSCGGETIKYAAFPMMRKPMAAEDEEEVEDVVGNRAVLEFDPEHGEAGKTDWLEAPILSPIEAILKWIDRKVDETFRTAHLSGVHGQRKSNNDASSGIALRYEFQQLNAVLSQKSVNLTEAERNIIRLWLKWQNMEDKFKDIEITRDQNFSIDDLAMNLDNTFRAISEIPSKTFAQLLQKSVVKQMLPSLTDDDYTKIDTEISEAPDKTVDTDDSDDDDPDDPDLQKNQYDKKDGVIVKKSGIKSNDLVKSKNRQNQS